MLEILIKHFSQMNFGDDMNCSVGDVGRSLAHEYLGKFGMPNVEVKKVNYCQRSIFSVCAVANDRKLQTTCAFYKDHSYAPQCRFCKKDIGNHCDNFKAQYGEAVITTNTPATEELVVRAWIEAVYRRRMAEMGWSEQMNEIQHT